MGYKFEAWSWEMNDDGEYEYRSLRQSQHFLPILLAVIKAKRRGIGCVKIDWR